MILEAVTNIPITETISNHNLSCVSPRKKKIYIYIYLQYYIYTSNNAHFETVAIQYEQYRQHRLVCTDDLSTL